MKSTLEIILSPYCVGILNDDQFIVIKKGRIEEDATLQILETSTDGLKKQRDHLKALLKNDHSIANKDRKELEVPCPNRVRNNKLRVTRCGPSTNIRFGLVSGLRQSGAGRARGNRFLNAWKNACSSSPAYAAKVLRCFASGNVRGERV